MITRRILGGRLLAASGESPPDHEWSRIRGRTRETQAVGESIKQPFTPPLSKGNPRSHADYTRPIVFYAVVIPASCFGYEWERVSGEHCSESHRN